MSFRIFVYPVIVLMLLCAGVFVSGCNDDNDAPSLPAGYQIIEGDSIIIIPDSAVAFAGTRTIPNHFDYNAYMLREYQIATDPNYNADPYTGDLADWKNEDWFARQTYFENAPGYTHDILTSDAGEYFHMIGIYFNQFGFGWRDTYDWQNVDVNVATSEHIWAQSGDDANTASFDGASPWFYQYRSMWIRRHR